MHFKYLAIVAGGIGPDVWDAEVAIEGEDMTIRDALHQIESKIEISGDEGIVISIERSD